MIKRYVAKPVEVTGIEWTGENFLEIWNFCNGNANVRKINGERILFIETTEGSSRAQLGDTIIRGTQGEFYPVKPRVMEAKYDEVTDAES